MHVSIPSIVAQNNLPEWYHKPVLYSDCERILLYWPNDDLGESDGFLEQEQQAGTLNGTGMVQKATCNCNCLSVGGESTVD
jgi:hypothetical protein